MRVTFRWKLRGSSSSPQTALVDVAQLGNGELRGEKAAARGVYSSLAALARSTPSLRIWF
jgi:hypothetical protein